jgi:6-phosphogluconolactonase
VSLFILATDGFFFVFTVFLISFFPGNIIVTNKIHTIYNLIIVLLNQVKMKKTNLFLWLCATALLLFNGCQKDDSSSITTGNSTDEEIALRSQGGPGAVYIMDNATSGNNVFVFNRAADGTLSNGGSYATGGMGTGTGLGSQGSIISDNNYLYVSNAGSNDISVLDINTYQKIDMVPSEGVMPVSLSVFGNLLYVVNAGGDGNISGYTIDAGGHLNHISGSNQALSAPGAGPAQIQFNQNGEYLIVTEKMTNMITVYPVDINGVAGAGTSYPSAGVTPFGFALAKKNKLIVSEAFGGAPGQSAMSSYTLSGGNLSVITASAATHQTAACWVVVTNSGKYTYTTNTGSASITGYSIDNTGALTLLDATGITGVTEAGPIDMSLSNNSKYLYTLNSMGHSISMFMVNNDGSLDQLGVVSGLPASSVGMAAK